MEQGVASGSSGKCPFSGAAEDLSLFSDQYIADPYPTLNYLREEQPVTYNKETGYWLVTRYEDVQKCMRGGDGLSSQNTLEPLKAPCPAAIGKMVAAGVNITGALINEDPPQHTLHRQALQLALSPKRLRELESFVRDEARKSMDKIIKLGHADLMNDYAFWIPAHVVFHLMRVPDEDIPQIKQWVTGTAKFIWGFPTEAEQETLAQNLGEYWKYTAAHLKKLEADLQDDFVSEMIRQHLADPVAWPSDYITWLTLNFMFAGHETAAGGMGSGIRLVLENRDQWEMLVADPSLIPNAAEEMLRHTGPVLAWRRITTKEMEFSGVRVPAGAKLKIMLGGANRDGRLFENPDKFDIKRPNANRHMTFGVGPHTCMGAPLARIELKVMLEEMVKRMPHVHLVQGQTFHYPYTTTHRGPEKVLAEWDATKNPIAADRPIPS